MITCSKSSLCEGELNMLCMEEFCLAKDMQWSKLENVWRRIQTSYLSILGHIRAYFNILRHIQACERMIPVSVIKKCSNVNALVQNARTSHASPQRPPGWAGDMRIASAPFLHKGLIIRGLLWNSNLVGAVCTQGSPDLCIIIFFWEVILLTAMNRFVL